MKLQQYPQLAEWYARRALDGEIIAELDLSDNNDFVPCGLCGTEIFWDDTPDPQCLPECA